MLVAELVSWACLQQKLVLRMSSVYVPRLYLARIISFIPLKIDMSNIIDQAQKIIEANGFKDSASDRILPTFPLLTLH